MDPVDLTPQIEQLEGNIDGLEEVLRPLLENALSATAANLPLLDKAKLYVLIVYSIESLLFCKNLPSNALILMLIKLSLSEAERRGREKSPSLPGTDQSQAIL